MKNIAWKLQEEIHFYRKSFFGFLFCAFHKEPIEIADFDPSYLENYFKFLQAVKTTVSLVKDLQNKVNFTKKCLTPHSFNPLYVQNYFEFLNAVKTSGSLVKYPKS